MDRADESNVNEKEQQTKELFDKMASHYNRTTQILTLGMIGVLQNYMLKKSNLRIAEDVIDVACGTGQLSFKIAKSIGLQGDVVGVDFSEEMIKVARKTAIKKDVKHVEFRVANALDLPFDENSFGMAFSSFSLRNVGNVKKAIEEMARVIENRGQVVCLEAAIPSNKILALGFKLLVFQIIPLFAKVINKIKKDDKFFDHEWLSQSFKQFPSQAEIEQTYSELGLVKVKRISLIGGLFTIYLGEKQ